MSDDEWIQKHKPKNPRSPPHKPPTPPIPDAAASSSTDVLSPVAKSNSTILTIGLVIALLAGYGYLSKDGQAERKKTQQSTIQVRPAPRVLTAAEIQANDDQNRAYLKKLDDDYNRKQISSDILRLNDIASRFNDINQVASATSRIALPQLVQQMQALRREVDSTVTHQCLIPATAALGSALSEIVNAYLAFMQTGEDTNTGRSKQHIDSARTQLTQYTKHRDSCVTW